MSFSSSVINLIYSTSLEDLEKICSQISKHIEESDDFVDNPEPTYKKILEFLGVDPTFKPVFVLHNPARRYRSRKLQSAMKKNTLGLRGVLNKIPGSSSAFRAINQPIRKQKTMNAELRKKLQKDVKSEVDELGKILNRDLSFWCEN